MTLSSQVKVISADHASFGGVGLLRVSVLIGMQPAQLLIHQQYRHEQGRQVQGHTCAYLMNDAPATAARPLVLQAEWGEPLGNIEGLATDPRSGAVLAYHLALKLRSGDMTRLDIAAGDTYWWNGELCATKRLAYSLRDLQRGRRSRMRSNQTAA